MSSGERPIGAAKSKQPNDESLCQTPPLRLDKKGLPPPPPSTTPLGVTSHALAASLQPPSCIIASCHASAYHCAWTVLFVADACLPLCFPSVLVLMRHFTQICAMRCSFWSAVISWGDGGGWPQATPVLGSREEGKRLNLTMPPVGTETGVPKNPPQPVPRAPCPRPPRPPTLPPSHVRHLLCCCRDQSDGNLYTSLKQLTLQTSVVTQCVLVNPTQKGGQGTKAQMTAVQVCAKLGGIPWQVESKFGLDPKGTMVIGIDFHHSVGVHERCSLMGLVATMDITTMECWQTAVEVPSGMYLCCACVAWGVREFRINSTRPLTWETRENAYLHLGLLSA